MKFAWNRGTLLSLDSKHNQLWEKWFYLIDKGSYNNGDPFPLVNLSEQPNKEVYKQLENTFHSVSHLGISLHDFVDWICYAIGISWCSEKPRVTEKAHTLLKEQFPWEGIISHPADYFSYFLAANGSSGVLEYYPTPSALSRLLTTMVEPSLGESVIEPCIGAGGIILTTNTLNMVGMDLNLLMVKASCIQAFFYKPQLLYSPRPLTNVHLTCNGQVERYFEFDTDTRIYRGDSLLGEFVAPKHIFREGSELVDIYVNPKRERNRSTHHVRSLMSTEWTKLSYNDRLQAVKAFARERPFEYILTNPPFSMKLGSEYKRIIEEIEKDNVIFLAEINAEPVTTNQLEPHQLLLF